MLRVYSIFDSIQGESLYQGLPMTFIRLAGCPLSCLYCDTREACVSEGAPMSVDAIVNQTLRLEMPFVEVTGGEPLFQVETPTLLAVLAGHFDKVLLETSGAFPLYEVIPEVHVVMDIKCPDSGMSHHFLHQNLSFLENRDHELKFVISSQSDFDWSVDFCTSNHLLDREIVFSPVTSLVSASDLAQWILKRRLNTRLRIQLHKLLWPDATEEI